MKRLIAGAAAVLLLSACVAGVIRANAEFRPLPIDTTGGAPLDAEYETELLVYEDPTIRVERTKRTKNKELGIEYYLIDVVIQDASQLRTAPADPTGFISERRVIASTIAKRVNAVLAFNGDYCGDFHGHESSKFVLRQGEIYRNTVDTRLDTLLIDEDGDFHILPGGGHLASLDMTQVDGKRVINVLQFGPGLIIDGEPAPDEYLNDKEHSPQFADPSGHCARLCLIQAGPLHYKVLATRDYATMSEFRDLLLMLVPDCVNAYVLDGGGSLQVIFLGERINKVTATTSQNQRKISDIVYFASAWFEED